MPAMPGAELRPVAASDEEGQASRRPGPRMKRGAWLPAALPKGLDPDDLMVARRYRQLSKVSG